MSDENKLIHPYLDMFLKKYDKRIACIKKWKGRFTSKLKAARAAYKSTKE